MKDIILIESIKADMRGVVVSAIVENVNCSETAERLTTPPDFAPIRCTITVPYYYLPPLIDYFHLGEDELEELLNKHVNLNEFEWVPSVSDNKDDDKRLMRVFF